jgi:hypothetical protein
VYAPNGDHESTPKLAIQDLDHDAIANWTLKLMTQSGRKYELQQLEFILTVYSLGDGTGRLTNPMLDSATSKYIITIQTNPNETNCMARAIVVGLAVNQLLGKFKNTLTENEIKTINSRKIIKSKLNDGVTSDEEIYQIKKGLQYKIQ